MPYDITDTKIYAYSFEDTYKAAYLSVKAMKGKILKHDLENRRLHAQMDKKLYGKVLGDRSKLEISFSTEAGGETKMSILAFPLDAIGNKLMFGARKGVVETVLAAFYAEVDKRLAEGK
jgi:hypothetical protein